MNSFMTSVLVFLLVFLLGLVSGGALVVFLLRKREADARTQIEEKFAAQLATRDDELVALREEKSALATRLATLESQRENRLHEAGFAAGSEGIDAWLAANAASTPTSLTSTAIPALWQQLIDLAAEAKRENETNGKLIAALTQQNQQALGILLGQSADTTTYNADGQQKSVASRRPLGSA